MPIKINETHQLTNKNSILFCFPAKETKATQSNAEDASLNSLAQISPSKPVSPSAPATHTSTLPAATQSVVLHQCSSHEALDNQTTVEVQKDLNWSENHFPNDLPSQKQVFGDQFDAIRDQLLVETDSWRTAKRWTTATAIKGETRSLSDVGMESEIFSCLGVFFFWRYWSC